MRVLKKGRPQNGPWAKKCKCSGAGNGGGGCGALLMVEAKDLFRTESHSYDGSHECYVTFECQECTAWTDIDSTAVPGVVLAGLKKRVPGQRRNR